MLTLFGGSRSAAAPKIKLSPAASADDPIAPDEHEQKQGAESSVPDAEAAAGPEGRAVPARSGVLGFVLGLRARARDEVKKRKDAMESKFFSYGPPYRDDYGGDLLQECMNPQAGWLEIHQMLLDGADPRIQDGEEGTTALHQVARNCRLDLCKILVKAGAKINQQNAFGVTALGTACMFNQPEPLREKHTQLVKWLLKKGADANHFDRAGHCALEFSAEAGNMDVVMLLLNAGAKVTRTTQYISFHMPTVLDVAGTNREVHRLLALRAAQERTELQERTDRRNDELKRQKLAKERALLMEQKKAQREQDKIDALKRAALLKRRQEVAKAKAEMKKQRRLQAEQRQAADSRATSDLGAWKRQSKMQWERRSVEQDAHARFVSATKHKIQEAVDLTANKQTKQQQRRLRQHWTELTNTQIEQPMLRNFQEAPSTPPDPAEKENLMNRIAARRDSAIAPASKMDRDRDRDRRRASEGTDEGGRRSDRKDKKRKESQRGKLRPIKPRKAIDAKFTPLSPGPGSAMAPLF